MATVVLPRSLVALFPGAERRVTVPGESVGQVVDELDERWPGMRNRLCDSGPAIRDFINVFVDGEQATLDSPVRPDATVHFLPAVAGG